MTERPSVIDRRGWTGLSGKVAIVTGGASGIGEATALRLSAEGAKVVVVDWNGKGAQAAAEALPGPAVAVEADVSREEGVEGYMRTALEKFGRIDLVHLNAGISGPFSPLVEVTTEDFDRVIAINLRGVFFGLRAALRQLAEQGGGGAIVTTSSLLGIQATEGLTPYTAAKHGVVGLTKTAALQAAAFGVRVNAIAPGFIVTGLMDDLRRSVGDDEAVLGKIEQSIPLRRFASPDEVGALVAFLLSDDASYLTGAVIPIDGGYGLRAR